MPWSKKFREPIRLPNGHKLVTLSDAGEHILKLPQKRKAEWAWMTATEMLIKAAEEGGGWIDLARIGIMQAIESPQMRPARSAAKKRDARRRSPLQRGK